MAIYQIEYRRQHDMRNMESRFRRVGLEATHFCHGRCYLEVKESRALILAPSSSPTWTVPELYNLLALIFAHGRPSKYELTLREREGIAQFRLSIMVPAGEDPFKIANDLAECRKCVVHELWRME